MALPASESPAESSSRWLWTGEQAYALLAEALAGAGKSVRFEMYIYRADGSGNRFLAALEQAAARGVRVQVLVDGFGAAALPAGYWQNLEKCGGRVRVFNPLKWSSFVFRNHRKLVVVDDSVAFVGGYNIADEYSGDGLTRGWRDLGYAVGETATVRELADSFDAMFQNFDFRQRMLRRLRNPLQRPIAARHRPSSCVLLGGPRIARNQFRQKLLQVLRNAKSVQITSGYFLPDFRLRRALRQVVRRGGRVELMLAAKTDVPLAQLAARALYGTLLRGGIEIWEYEPQILHSKLAIVDGLAFVGSSNLDTRSFGINYELMVCVEHPRAVEEARKIFAADLTHATGQNWQTWHATQTWLTRLRGFFARILLTKVDPWLARRLRRSLS